MQFKASAANPGQAGPIPGYRCPYCKQVGTLELVHPNVQDIQLVHLPNYPSGYVVAAIRRCPNIACRALIFVVVNSTNGVLTAYPAERIDFDVNNVAPKVVAAMEEALVCHASQCYIAAAIMVRKTIEEICHDRGATGKTLFARIESLGKVIILPQAYIEGLHDLRLLGNDAAHIESEDYQQVDREEVEVGIEVAKDIIRAVYQQNATMERLKALKKSATT